MATVQITPVPHCPEIHGDTGVICLPLCLALGNSVVMPSQLAPAYPDILRPPVSVSWSALLLGLPCWQGCPDLEGSGSPPSKTAVIMAAFAENKSLHHAERYAHLHAGGSSRACACWQPFLVCQVLMANFLPGAGLDAIGGGRLFPDSPVGPVSDANGPVKAAPAIANAIRACPNPPLQLVCVGSLTNAALLISLYPELVAERRVEITVMGGAMGIGNTGPVQEFNIQTDPEAARIVFECGAKLTMIPLEV